MSTFKTSLFDLDSTTEAIPATKARKNGYDIPQIKLSYVSTPTVRRAKSVRSSDDIIKAFRASYEDGEIEYREHIKVAYLNQRNAIIGIQEVGSGTDTASLCDIKALFAGAILCRAASIILCHNHPSGALTASIADDKLTRNVKQGAELFNMRLLDHIILTEESFYSYNDNGRL